MGVCVWCIDWPLNDRRVAASGNCNRFHFNDRHKVLQFMCARFCVTIFEANQRFNLDVL